MVGTRGHTFGGPGVSRALDTPSGLLVPPELSDFLIPITTKVTLAICLVISAETDILCFGLRLGETSSVSKPGSESSQFSLSSNASLLLRAVTPFFSGPLLGPESVGLPARTEEELTVRQD